MGGLTEIAKSSDAVTEKAKQVTELAVDKVEKAKHQGGSTASAIKSLISGGFGGVCAVLVGHPFDLVKVRLQTAEKGVYTGSIDVVKKSMARDGFKGLYRGVTAPLLGVTPMFAVSFWGYDVGKTVVKKFSTVSETGMTLPQYAFAGFFSAIPMTAITAPFERIKIVLQIQGQSDGAQKQYSGGFDALRGIYKEGGLRSGSLATIARDGPGSAMYFVVYEYVKRRLTPEGHTFSPFAVVMAGGLAGVAMWTLVFPVDTIKSSLQASSTPTTLPAVIRQLHAKGGVGAFFPGLGPALLRSFPANSATFLGVEIARKALDSLF